MEDESQRLMDQTPLPGNSLVDFYEGLLLQLSSQFHPHHYLLMKIKSNLISQYGNVPKYHYSKLSTELVSKVLHTFQLPSTYYKNSNRSCNIVQKKND